MQAFSKVLLAGLAASALAVWAPPSLTAKPQVGVSGNPDFKGAARSPSALNPKGLPGIPTCKKIDLSDPQALAKANIAKQDRRPFMIYGFTRGTAPGIFCPSGEYTMDRLGGTFVSDIPDACGAHSFSNAEPEAMTEYNRILAADSAFQKITGCRPANVCEERYKYGGYGTKQRDPECPGNLKVFNSIAVQGQPGALKAALQDFADGTPASLDAITTGFINALRSAKWENAEILLAAGADVNGTLKAKDQTSHDDRSTPQGVDSPLAAVFYQSFDKQARIERARWLMEQGADFSNPAAAGALRFAARSEDEAAVAFLLDRGVPVSGDFPAERLDARLTGDIANNQRLSAPQTPFSTAIRTAIVPRSVSSPEAIAKVAEERAAARRIAVTLYENGARFLPNDYATNLRIEPQIKPASILLAAAHRDGRFDELIEALIHPNGRDKPAYPANSSDKLKEFIGYLEALKVCDRIDPRPMGDHVKLCVWLES
ncbi:MAG: hypothetical protein AAFY81_02675 [Pseudomonadota bacterium]